VCAPLLLRAFSERGCDQGAVGDGDQHLLDKVPGGIEGIKVEIHTAVGDPAEVLVKRADESERTSSSWAARACGAPGGPWFGP